MPIYGFGLIGAPWSFCASITKKKYLDIRACLIKAMDNKKYMSAFLHSIDVNFLDDTTFLARYDMSKTNINEAYYQEYMSKLIEDANEILSSKRKYNNYKIDIMGSFVIGKIIIMEKK